MAGLQASLLAAQHLPCLGCWSWGGTGLILPPPSPTPEWWAKGSGVLGAKRPQVLGQAVQGLPGTEVDQGIKAAQSGGSALSAGRAGPRVGGGGTARPLAQLSNGHWGGRGLQGCASLQEEEGAALGFPLTLKLPEVGADGGTREQEGGWEAQGKGHPRYRTSRPASALEALPTLGAGVWQD